MANPFDQTTLTVDPYEGTTNAFTEGMWAEMVASFKPSGDDVFNKRSGEASLTGIVPNACLQAAMRYMLGYDQVASAPDSSGRAVYTLCRKNPIQHPYYAQLWCNGVSVKEFKPDSYNRATIKRPSLPTDSTEPPRLSYRAGYKFAQIQLRFAPAAVKYRQDTNDALYQSISASRMEWVRNTSIDLDPRIETFETVSQYIFAEGTGAPSPYTNPSGKTATAGRAQLIMKPDVKMMWTDVPRDWLMPLGVDNELPTNILDALGTVNDATFRGFPAGTLLFLGAKMERFPWALKPPSNVVQTNIESSHQYNLELYFSYFNPPKGFANTPPKRITTNLGHNNFPWPGTQTVGVSRDPNGGLWFFGTLNGDPKGSPLFQSSKYPKIFDSPNNNPPPTDDPPPM